MKHLLNLATALFLLLGASPALADDGVLLLGCVAEPEGGSTVTFAESSSPIPLNGTVISAERFMGESCAAVLRQLLDNERVSTADIAASSHVVLTTPRQVLTQSEDGDEDCCPDCIIWDIDTANVYSQLTCDPLGAMAVVGQESEGSAAAPGFSSRTTWANLARKPWPLWAA